MNGRDLQHLLYIRKYSKMIADSICRFGAEYEKFEQDDDYFNSVSMSIMQIGEHAKWLSQTFTDSTKEQVRWHAIRGIRNMLAHEYIAMDKSRVWVTALTDIPKLLLFCNDALKENGVSLEPDSVRKPSVRERLRLNRKAISENSPTEKKNKD